jgi:hypothetical protein
MANEMSSVRLIAGLNQGLPNNPAAILEFARKFENILFDKVPAKECKEFMVDNFLERFINDVDFRNGVIALYDKHKDFINPFRVALNND